MENSTKFLDDIMSNNIHRYLVIDVTDKPTFEDWWRFEEECLGGHFGILKEESVQWRDIWFTTKGPDNFIVLEVNIINAMYEVLYKTEVENLECFFSPIDLIIPFSEIYNKYLLKPLPETLGESKNKNISILSQEELDELCGIIDEKEQANMFDTTETNEDLLRQNKRPTTMSNYLKGQEEELKEAQEEIDSLNSTIKDMEEIIKRYEHNLTFIWTMLEQKIKENR